MTKVIRPPMSSTTIVLELNNILESAEYEVQRIMHDSINDFKETVSQAAQDNVYDFPQGNYIRRGTNGGLSDTSNYEVVEGELSLTLTNRTTSGEPFGYSIDTTDVVENGNGYGWNNIPPRPFMDKALDKFVYEVLEPRIEKALGGER